MQTTFALAALASVAYALPQGTPGGIAPQAPSPPGCSQNYNGQFQITTVNASTIAKRQSTCGQTNFLTAKLSNGELTDAQGRIGSIVANYQFQFDGPPAQAGALYTSGFSVCQNGSLALGGSAVFYSCQSGQDAFSNLYDRAWQPACKPIYISVLPCSGGAGVSQQPDGQPTAATSVAPVTQIGDGQPQAQTTAAAPVTQIGDGQIQGPTTAAGPPVSQIGDGQVQAPTAAPAPKPVSQISDGQVQAPVTATAKPVSQISDGQVQAPVTATAKPVSQISDGQVQAPVTATGTPVSQISDGQVQAPVTATPVPTTTAKPVSQISDGQVQAPTTVAGPAVSQIPDGQLQAPVNGTRPVNATPTFIPVNTANGFNVAGSMVAVVFGIAAVLLL